MIFLLLIIGLGVKAALVPLHGWLPQAMVAPAPVSALLHAVAVVKAGAFGIVRVVYDVYGVNFTDQLGLLTGLGIAAAITIIYGSIKALSQDNLKKRLAYSTVSQVSYIALGTAILGPVGTIGGIVHLVHQGIMKITLFFAAGNYAETLGIHKVSEMNGVGRRMPATTLAFSIAALGMIGVPPVAGFVSKWYLGLGALEAGMAAWVMPVLITSSVLNAAYFLPVLYRAWFREPGPAWPAEHIPAARFETSRGPAVAAGGDRNAGTGRRPVCRRTLQPAGVGDPDCATGVRPVNALHAAADLGTAVAAGGPCRPALRQLDYGDCRHCLHCSRPPSYPSAAAFRCPGCCSASNLDSITLAAFSCSSVACCGCWPACMRPAARQP